MNFAKKSCLIRGVCGPYYKYKPETVLENGANKMYYDHTILTDHIIPHNRPDITFI